MKLMMTLIADSLRKTDIDAISAHLARQRVNVLGSEQLLDEGATISEQGESPAVVARDVSALRAIWIFDMPSRAAAVELAKNAPDGEGTLEVRESFTPQDFGAPPVLSPLVAPPPPVRKPKTHRYIAMIRADLESGEAPTLESIARMDAYCAPLVEANTMIGGEGLKPSTKGTRVRHDVRDRCQRGDGRMRNRINRPPARQRRGGPLCGRERPQHVLRGPRHRPAPRPVARQLRHHRQRVRSAIATPGEEPTGHRHRTARPWSHGRRRSRVDLGTTHAALMERTGWLQAMIGEFLDVTIQ
jgi:hypothetical protein